jgi:hypothetical protein
MQSYNQGGPKNLKITNAILYFICRDYQPISVAENELYAKVEKTFFLSRGSLI